MPTAQQLIDNSVAITQQVVAINAKIQAMPLPLSADAEALSKKGVALAIQANVIGQAGLAALANDVASAVDQLTAQVNAASTLVTNINDLKKALGVVDIVLAGAVDVAGSVASGNWIGAASDVVSVANKLQTAVATATPAGG